MLIVRTYLSWWPVKRLALLSFLLAILLSCFFASSAMSANITHVAHKSNKQMTVLEISFDRMPQLKVSALNFPKRLALDFPRGEWHSSAPIDFSQSHYVDKVRFGAYDADTSRLVIDLPAYSKLIAVSFSVQGALLLGFADQLAPVGAISASHAEQLINSDALLARYSTGASVPEHQQPEQQQIAYQPAPDTALMLASRTDSLQLNPYSNYEPLNAQPSHEISIPRYKPQSAQRGRKPLIILDPGHGGRDRGAKSQDGLIEKELTLSFAKILRDVLLETGEYDVRLTRDKDVFLSLDERVRIAAQHQGDLMISIHADSNPVASLSGASIYTLSEKASDSAAAAAAKRENASDDYAFLEDAHGTEANKILMDIAFTSSANASHRAAEQIVSQLRSQWPMLKRPHRQAGFRVLKNAQMPALLLEIGYLTNHKDVARLRDAKKKQQLAKALRQGIDKIFEDG